MTSVQIVAQPSTVKMITGETFIAYALYAKIPAEPSDEDLDILDAMDIHDSMFVIAPTFLINGNDGCTFTPWVPHTDINAFRIERGDIIISSPLSKSLLDDFDKYVASKNIVLADAVANIFKQLGLDFEDKPTNNISDLTNDKSVQYLASLNNIEKQKH